MNPIGPFSFGGYRSFASRQHRFPSVSKINLIAGPNNSGKSNVLTLLHGHYGKMLNSLQGQHVQWDWSPLDRHQGPDAGSFSFGLGVALAGNEHKALRETKSVVDGLGERGSDMIDRFLKGLSAGTTHAWFDFQATTPGTPFEIVISDKLKDVIQPPEWHQLWNALTGHRDGDRDAHWIPQTLAQLQPKPPPATVVLIDAVRKIGEAGSKTEGNSGSGIIDQLAQYQNPGHEDQGHKLRFEAINHFLQTVLDDTSAHLEIPYDRNTILVHQSGRTLPLQSLGTGVHEVIILAAAATVRRNEVILY